MASTVDHDHALCLAGFLAFIRGVDIPETIEQARVALVVRALTAEALLKRYLDNHCKNADAEGMSALCGCKLCLETRKAIFQ